MRNNFVLAVFLFLQSTTAFSATSSSVGYIDEVQIMGSHYKTYSVAGHAIAFIFMSELPVACGNSSGIRRVAVGSDHPAFNVLVSTALSAKAAQQRVKLYYVNDSCSVFSSAWDFAILRVL